MDALPSVKKVPATQPVIRQARVVAAGAESKEAEINCRPIPQMMTRQFIFLFSAERIHAKPIKTNIPAKLTIL